jgi:HJR/Mrr/RecB family endonuclease
VLAVWQVKADGASATETAALATAVCLEMSKTLDEYTCKG